MLFQRTNKKLLLYKTVIWQQALLIVGSFVLCSLMEDGVERKRVDLRDANTDTAT